MINHKDKVLITGGSGMLGKAFKEYLPDAIYVSSKQCDLRKREQVDQLFNEYKPEYVFHLASRVGGVLANMQNLGAFYFDNITMNTNVLDAARVSGVTKLLSCLSTCIYPDDVEYPLTEKQIHNGPPHSSNYTYAYTKRMLDIQSKAYRQQYGCNFISMSPNNLFGEHDNFDLQGSHVIPAIIRKIYEAKHFGNEVVLWGDGTPMREFTYVKDICRIAIFLMEKYDDPEPINVGTTGEHTIFEIVEKVSHFIDYNGEVSWDIAKPNGQFRKPSCNSKLVSLGWNEKDYTSFDLALKSTCDWFTNNYPNLRGIK